MEYIIDEKELKRLIKRDQLLSILEVAGVDNWMSYNEAARLCDMELPTEDFLDEEIKKYRPHENN